MASSSLIKELKSYFLYKTGGVINGNILVGKDGAYDLGSSDKAWRTLYVDEVHTGNLVVDEGTDPTQNADTVDGYHASATATAGYLLALQSDATFPTSAYKKALLIDGTRSLLGNLVVGGGYTIDGVDISEHTHDGTVIGGQQIDHLNLLNNDADVHPQYTQRGQDEIVTGDWFWSSDEYDRSLGWEFLTDDNMFRSRPLNLALQAGLTWSRITLGEDSDLLLEVSDSETFFKAGVDDDVVKISATDPTYRLWAGALSAESAPFRVDKDGALYSTQGLIAGWSIDTDQLYRAGIYLSEGEIRVGFGDADVAILGTNDTDNWRFWVGNEDPLLAAFRVKSTGEVYMTNAHFTGTIESSNYVSSQLGWHIDQSGFAEFYDVSIRGKITSTVFEQERVSVVGGRLLITDGAVLAEDISTTATELVVQGDVFTAEDIIQLAADSDRIEWMKVLTDGTSVGDGNFSYTVIRGLAGTSYEFYSGESVFRKGSGTVPEFAEPFGSYAAMLGDYQFGGAPYKAGGGFLTLEGSREYGPYFGVARRFGGQYDQIADVARFGRLKGFLNITDDVYGVAIGDGSQWFRYDYTTGLSIKTKYGDTTLDDNGLQTKAFALLLTDTTPDYTLGKLRLWIDESDHRLKGRIKDGSFEKEVAIADFGDSTEGIGNANSVGGYFVYDTPMPNSLLVLDDEGDLPTNITGDAKTLEGHVYSDFATAGHDHDADYAPIEHGDTHKAGGSDALRIDELADPQDTTDLNADETHHGLLPKLSGAEGEYLNGAGEWSTPPSGSGSLQPAHCRISLNSTSALPGDGLTSDTLYLLPYDGDELGLYKEGNWIIRYVPDTGVSLSLTGLSADTNYDVFVSLNVDNLELTAIAWADDTTRSEELGNQDGVLVRSSDSSQRYLGTIRTTSAGGQAADSCEQRYVWNYYNRIPLKLFVCPNYSDDDSVTTYTVSTSAMPFDAGGLSWVTGVASPTHLNASLMAKATGTGGGTARGGIGPAGSGPSWGFSIVIYGTNDYGSSAHSHTTVAAGYQTCELYMTASTGTATFYADYFRHGGLEDPAATYITGLVF